jgi:hypothetical protein
MNSPALRMRRDTKSDTRHRVVGKESCIGLEPEVLAKPDEVLNGLTRLGRGRATKPPRSAVGQEDEGIPKFVMMTARHRGLR